MVGVALRRGGWDWFTQPLRGLFYSGRCVIQILCRLEPRAFFLTEGIGPSAAWDSCTSRLAGSMPPRNKGGTNSKKTFSRGESDSGPMYHWLTEIDPRYHQTDGDKKVIRGLSGDRIPQFQGKSAAYRGTDRPSTPLRSGLRFPGLSCSYPVDLKRSPVVSARFLWILSIIEYSVAFPIPPSRGFA